MKETKIYYALSRLEKSDRKRLLKYLQSPYFNTDQLLVVWYQQILKNEKLVAKGKFSKTDLWNLVRTEERFNDTRFRKYNSDLLKHVEGFLYQEFTRQDKGHEYPFILDALNERRMEKLYNSVLRSGRDAIRKNPRRDSRYYQRVYAIEKRFYELSDSETKRGVAATTSDIADALDYFYIIEKLRIHCSVLVRQFFLEDDYKLRLIDGLLLEIENEGLTRITVINVYYRLVKTYKAPGDIENFHSLKELIQSNHELFSADELEDLYRGLLNFLVRNANKSDSNALEEIVTLYSGMLEKGVFNSQGELSPWAFKNAILAGLRIGSTDWVLRTLQQHSNKLPDDYRENALAFNYAQVYFYRKEYGRVLEYLQQVEYQDPAYALNSRNLLVAVYYELGQIEPLYSSINAFRTYLKRQKTLSARLVTAYRNLLNLILKLTKTTHRDSKKLESIQVFLKENPGTASQQWLSTKLEELKENKRNW